TVRSWFLGSCGWSLGYLVFGSRGWEEGQDNRNLATQPTNWSNGRKSWAVTCSVVAGTQAGRGNVCVGSWPCPAFKSVHGSPHWKGHIQLRFGTSNSGPNLRMAPPPLRC